MVSVNLLRHFTRVHGYTPHVRPLPHLLPASVMARLQVIPVGSEADDVYIAGLVYLPLTATDPARQHGVAWIDETCYFLTIENGQVTTLRAFTPQSPGLVRMDCNDVCSYRILSILPRNRWRSIYRG